MRTTRVSVLTWFFVMAAAATLAAESDPKNVLSDDLAKALKEGSSFTLMSVHPAHLKTIPGRSWKVLGEVPIKEAADRDTILSALEKARAEKHQNAHCFKPRHAISVRHENKTYLLLICFECYQTYIYVDGQQQGSFHVGRSAQKVFDKILEDGGARLADK